MEDVVFRKEIISMGKALDLLCYCTNEEAEEIYNAIEKVSPSTAIQARELRVTFLKVKAFKEQREKVLFTQIEKKE
jgi:hypothetical protein